MSALVGPAAGTPTAALHPKWEEGTCYSPGATGLDPPSFLTMVPETDGSCCLTISGGPQVITATAPQLLHENS